MDAQQRKTFKQESREKTSGCVAMVVLLEFDPWTAKIRSGAACLAAGEVAREVHSAEVELSLIHI